MRFIPRVRDAHAVLKVADRWCGAVGVHLCFQSGGPAFLVLAPCTVVAAGEGVRKFLFVRLILNNDTALLDGVGAADAKFREGECDAPRPDNVENLLMEVPRELVPLRFFCYLIEERT